MTSDRLQAATHTDLLLREPPAALLNPATLNERADEAVKAFFHEGQSANTARTYKTALQYWGAWHALRYGTPLTPPVPSNVVLQFIVDHQRSCSRLFSASPTS